jgi:hypothetical protein
MTIKLTSLVSFSIKKPTDSTVQADVVNADENVSSTKYGLLTRVVGLLTSLGSLTETAPGTDTASSGINGRLQRIAQRLTSIIALLPSSLGGSGGLKIEGVSGGTAIATVSGTDVVKAFVQVTSLSSAVGLGSIPSGSRWAKIEVEGQPVRYREDGTNPTTSVGHILNPGDIYDCTISDLTEFKAIETAASAKFNVTFYG